MKEFLIIMHNLKPYSEFEKEINKVCKKHKLKFIGSGYDMTNKRRDIEYRKNEI